MKTSELTGPALDWAVAQCESYTCKFDDEVSGAWLVPAEPYLFDEMPLGKFKPSTNWAQGGPIIERERIAIDGDAEDGTSWAASTRDAACYWVGPTPLIAAMRCYVASKLGDEVDVPPELTNKEST
jgi:hypothetical protein